MQGALKTHKTQSQCDKILAYLQQGNTLTVLQAMGLGFGMNLRSRVSNLKDKGYNIISKRLKTKDGFVAEYSLVLE